MSKRVRLDQATDEDFKGLVRIFRDDVEIARGSLICTGSEWGDKFAYDGTWTARMLFQKNEQIYYPDDEIEKVEWN